MKIKSFFPLSLCLFSQLTFAAMLPIDNTERYFASIQSHPQKVAQFLQQMPKGGDLHLHESGATRAENLLRYSANDNLCLDKSFVASLNPTCTSDALLVNRVKDPESLDQIIDAWSMRHFDASKESGHDHFFATFVKFNAITKVHHAEILSEIIARAARDKELYLEVMSAPDSNLSGKLGAKLGWDPDFGKMRDKLFAADFAQIVSGISTAITQDLTQVRTTLACDSTHPKPGCDVQVRFLYQVQREQAPEMVFAQLLAGFEAAKKDPRVVGLNMVQPEDGPISMRDYHLQMTMINYLHNLYPDVQVSLHAGELNNQIVTPEGLKFHIREAVELAQAKRIGHGVDIAQEDNSDQLLKEMAAQHVLVEINLTSNAVILGIDGKQHPLPLYLKYGVPVALSTDDEGVSRSNLDKEYAHAANTFQLDYLTLKNMARNSLTYAFAAGKSLWVDYNYRVITPECAKDTVGADVMSRACKAFLAGSDKATLQWKLEKQFNGFESQY